MAIPMEIYMEKLSDFASDLDLVDPMMYRQMIGSLLFAL